MSYILEALKKAQAERQLGNAPTIHAPQPVQVSAAAGATAANRKPLLLGLGGGALVVLLGAAVLWHREPSPQAPKLAQAAPAATSTASAAGATATGAATLAVRAPDLPPPAAAAPRVAETHAVPAPVPARSAHAPAPGAGADARVASTAGAAAPSAAAAQPQLALPAARRPAGAPAPAAVPAPAPENSLPLVQQLPEAIRNQIPHVAFGGYMYSANPADRLVLIDNALRHEGEEVAPGLVLEKLMPKAAVMNFRGVRYRVAY